MPGPAQAWLVFRVGAMDETLRTRGISRLVTGLALDELDSGGAAYGAFASGPTTSIELNGTRAQVASILQQVWAKLESTDTRRFETVREREVLHSGWRVPDGVDEFLAMRFGPRGAGLTGQPELGLHHLGPAPVLEWRERFFGPRNAALVLKNVSPDDVELPGRPEGTWRAPPEPQPRPLALPAWFGNCGEDVAVSSVQPGTAAVDTFTATAVLRLRERLAGRGDHRAGLSSVRLWPGVDHLVLHCTAPARSAGRVRDAFLAVLEELASAGPLAEEIAARHRRLLEWKEDPESLLSRFEWAAHAHVLDPTGAAPGPLDHEDPPSASAVAEAGRGFLATALFGLPREVGMPVSYQHLPTSSERAVTGTAYRPAGGASGEDALVVGSEGVTLAREGRRATVLFDRCEAVVQWPDGTRTLYGSDGFGLEVRPREWERGAEAVAGIDARVDHGVVVTRRLPGDG